MSQVVFPKIVPDMHGPDSWVLKIVFKASTLETNQRLQLYITNQLAFDTVTQGSKQMQLMRTINEDAEYHIYG